MEEGRQTILIRKGGIEEAGGRFEVAHRDFVLYPTYEHQASDLVVPEAQAWFDAVVSEQPRPGRIRIGLSAKVAEVFEIPEIRRLKALAGLHIWAPRVIEQRFAYGEKAGAVVLLIRAFRLPAAVEFEELPKYAGCRSWVPLAMPVATRGATSVLTDEQFAAQADAVRAILS